VTTIMITALFIIFPARFQRKKFNIYKEMYLLPLR